MSLFDKLGGDRPQQMSPAEIMQRLRSNPADTLRQAGLNVPDGMSDPQAIVNHLLQTGQINNPKLQMAQQLFGRFFRR